MRAKFMVLLIKSGIITVNQIEIRKRGSGRQRKRFEDVYPMVSVVDRKIDAQNRYESCNLTIVVHHSSK